MNIIEVQNLSFSYPGQTPLLRSLNFTVSKGEIFAIAGPNGAGKTTLLKLLCALLKADAGAITIIGSSVEEYSVRRLARTIAVVRQDSAPVFDFTVTQVVSMARTAYLGTLGFESQSDRDIVSMAMEMTDTAAFAARPLGQLSGGERQRVYIARAIAQDTDILLLDEPTSFLDMKHQVAMYDLLKKMQMQKNRTIVLVSHDINLVSQYCDSALLLGPDGSCDFGPVEQIISKDRIEKIFSVRTFSGVIGRRLFFLPKGDLAAGSRTTSEDKNVPTKQSEP